MTKKTKTILLIEDNEGHAEQLFQAFDVPNDQVCLEVVRNTKEAQDYLAESLPDLVIADLTLKDAKAAQLFLSNQFSLDFPLVVIAPRGDDSSIAKAMEAKALDYVIKSNASLKAMPRIIESVLREWKESELRGETGEMPRSNCDHLESLVKECADALMASNERLKMEIEERKRIEAALRGHLQFLETILDSIPRPVYYKDLECKYQGCNDAFARQIIGLPKPKIMGRTLRDFPEAILRGLEDIYHDHDEALIRCGEDEACESQVHCADGITRHFHCSKTACRDGSGHVVGIVGVMSAVVERNQGENERLYLEKLEGALEMAGAVCHEINQPMQSICGYSELMLMRLLEDEPFQREIRAINEQVERMADMTRKLMRITRYESKGGIG
jgi:PAS domain S-box-containing protein